MTTSKKKQTASQIKRKGIARIKRRRKAATTAALKVARAARRKHSRSAQTSKRARRPGRTKKKISLKAKRHQSNSPDLLIAAIDEAVKVETNAVRIARQFSLAGIDILETATGLLLTPAVMLDAALSPGKAKVLPFPAPTSPESPVPPRASVAA